MCIQTDNDQLIAAGRIVIKLHFKLYLTEFVSFPFYLFLNVSPPICFDMGMAGGKLV